MWLLHGFRVACMWRALAFHVACTWRTNPQPLEPLPHPLLQSAGIEEAEKRDHRPSTPNPSPSNHSPMHCAGIEEAKKRDHRLVGGQQDLFFFHPLSPGSCFFLPAGGRIYSALIELMREKYWEYEYEEVSGLGVGLGLRMSRRAATLTTHPS